MKINRYQVIITGERGVTLLDSTCNSEEKACFMLLGHLRQIKDNMTRKTALTGLFNKKNSARRQDEDDGR